MFASKLWKLPRNPAFPYSSLPIGSDRCCTCEFKLDGQSYNVEVLSDIKDELIFLPDYG